MRILCIRGKNLASLEGEFEVRLDADPLSTSGVFAIVGKTGAGKSTLIDALCLALFDATPRLEDRGGALVGREDDPTRLPANDVRNLLRKGAGDGYAEVEFEGVDGEVYVASWHTRRARGKATGAHQKQTMTLTRRATGERVGHGKKDTKQAIEQRLGLNFEQARRSMLLAQGEFAAFLTARGDERARLLEKVTGTFIYTKLSQAAYERAREVRSDLESVLARAGEHKPMLEAERKALDEERDARTVEAQGAKAAMELLKAAHGWRVTDGSLEADIEKACAALTAADQGVVESGARRSELERTEAAAAHRSTVEGAKRAVASEKACKKLRVETLVTRAAAKAIVLESEASTVVTKKRADASTAALEAARPTLMEARRLDAQVTPLAETAATLADVFGRVAAAGMQLALEHGALPALLSEARVEHTTAHAWLGQHAAYERQVRKWESVRADLEGLRELDAKETRASVDLAALGGADARCAEKQREVQAALTGAAAEVATCETAVEFSLTERRSLFGQRDLDLERTTLGERRARLDALRRAAAQHGETSALVTKLDGELEAAIQKRQRATAAAVEQRAEMKGLEAARDSQRAAHHRVLAQLDLSEHRAQLRPGEACPLCGSEDHPSADVTGLSELAQDFAAQVEAAETAVQQSHGNIARSEALAAEQSRQVERTEAARQTQSDKLAKLVCDWARDAQGLVLPATPSAAESALDQLSAQDRDEAQTLDQAFADRKRCDEQVDAERARLAVARTTHEMRATEAKGANDERAQVAQRIAAAKSSLEAWSEARERRESAVDAVLEGPWRERFAADPVSLIDEGDELAVQWASFLQRREAAAVSIEDHESRHCELAGQLANAIPRFAEAKAAAEAKTVELEALRSQRRQLLAGRPAVVVEAELTDTRDTTHRALKSASAAHLLRTQKHAKAAHDATAAESAHVQATADTQSAQTQLTAAISSTGFDLTELERLLTHDLEWTKATRATLASIDDAVTRAKTRIQERTESLSRHRSARPMLDFDTLDVQLDQATVAAAVADQVLLVVITQLELDDHHRRETAALLAELTAADELSQTWTRMKSLIGSKDGKLFRTFAQSLSLDILLQYANLHLQRLQPRYELQRVPGEDLELQVIDRDMGDEVRGVKSLSGGETFLASLALALGLASLTASHTTVDTLFIDEGFGALDADCLELALEVLDNLQESGRQVGVISHVEAIAERFTAQVRVDDIGGGRSRVRVVPEVSRVVSGDDFQPLETT